MKRISLSEYWAHFGKVYCISLEERKDRRMLAKEQFDAAGLSDRVEFHIAERDPHDCERGIYESHMACIRKGIASGAETIAIFEDDIVFDRITFESLGHCVSFLSTDTQWQALFFGCLVSGIKTTPHPSIVKIKYSSLAHAYVLKRNFAKTLSEKPWQGIAYDMFLKSFNGNYYAVYPSFAFQGDSPTDNNKHLLLDRFRRLCGGLCRVQKMNEFYHRNKVLVIALHVLLVLLGVLTFFTV